MIDLGMAPCLSWSEVYWILSYWKDLNLEWPAKKVSFPLTLFSIHFLDMH